MVIVKKGSAGKVLLILFAVLVGLILMGMVIASLAGVDLNAKKETDPCQENSFGYLYTLQQGLSNYGADYWKAGITPQNIIDVHSFKFVVYGPWLLGGRPYKVPRVYYQYEVESSTAGGMPIRKRWNVVMERDTVGVGGKPCAIVAVQP